MKVKLFWANAPMGSGDKSAHAFEEGDQRLAQRSSVPRHNAPRSPRRGVFSLVGIVCQSRSWYASRANVGETAGSRWTPPASPTRNGSWHTHHSP